MTWLLKKVVEAFKHEASSLNLNLKPPEPTSLRVRTKPLETLPEASLRQNPISPKAWTLKFTPKPYSRNLKPQVSTNPMRIV